MSDSNTEAYGLMDVETGNLIGEYRALGNALASVKQIVCEWGPESPEVASLSLARLDVPPEHGLIAEGCGLATLAETLC